MSTTPTMLMAYDGSPEAVRALQAAARLAAPKQVDIITAWEPMSKQAARAATQSGMRFSDMHAPDSTVEDPAYQEALRICTEGTRLAESVGLTARGHLVESATSIWSAIVDAAADLTPDLIVIGTRAETGLRALLTTSTTDNLLHNTDIPVFVVPPVDDDDVSGSQP